MKRKLTRPLDATPTQNHLGTLEELLVRIAKISKSVPPEQADTMSRDAKTITDEVSSSKPRRAFLDLAVQGLKDAAAAIGDVGKPILETVGKLLPLLLKLIP